jgi:chromosome partitioning protein
LSVQGLQRHLFTIREVQDNLNPALKVMGILINMHDPRSNFARDMAHRIRMEIGCSVPVFNTAIPKSIKAVEASAAGMSILEYAPGNSVAEAYRQLAMEVLAQERQRDRRKQDISR